MSIAAQQQVVGVIPAAGSATRLQPLPCSKEVYPVGGHPVMDHLIARMRAAGCTELRVVTRPQKHDVIGRAEHHRATVILGSPRSISESLATGIRDLPGPAVVLLGFPDTIWEPSDGFARLVAALEPPYDVVLGLFNWNEPERSDVVLLSEDGTVTGVAVKPNDPPGNLIWGCAAARAEALRGVERDDDPGSFFDALAKKRRVRGVYLSDSFLDIGTRDGLDAAVRAFGAGTA